MRWHGWTGDRIVQIQATLGALSFGPAAWRRDGPSARRDDGVLTMKGGMGRTEAFGLVAIRIVARHFVGPFE